MKPSVEDRQTIRVMTYNVLVDAGSDGRDTWPKRVDSVAGIIQFDSPSLVGLQEALNWQLTGLRERLAGYEWVGEGRLGGEDGEFCAIGYRTDRFELLSEETFWLSETPDVPGSTAWNTAYSRIATMVRVEERATGDELVFVNTHLDNVSTRARRKGATLIRDRVVTVEDTTPVIVCGDLNCEPGSEPYRTLAGAETNAPLRDTHEASMSPPIGPSITFPGFTDPTTGRRIDHVFVSEDVAVVQHATRADTREDGRFPSDHLPVIADLDLSTMHTVDSSASRSPSL